MSQEKIKSMAQYLGAITKMNRSVHKDRCSLPFYCLEDCLLQYGHFFKTQCEQAAYGPMKACFQNSFDAMFDHLEDGYYYTEGMAMTPNLPFPVHHAWLTKPDGAIWDPTWKEGGFYFGIPFSPDVVLDIIGKKGIHGLLDHFGLKMFSKHPEKLENYHYQRSEETRHLIAAAGELTLEPVVPEI